MEQLLTHSGPVIKANPACDINGHYVKVVSNTGIQN